MKQSTVLLLTACCGLTFIMWINSWFLREQAAVARDDVHLTSHRHKTELDLKPLDDYVKYYELPENMDCSRNKSTNASLAYLLDLPTPCSSGKENCVVAFSLFCGGVRHAFPHANNQCQRYTSHLSNLYGWKSVFAGWEIRVYTDDSVPVNLLAPFREFVNVITVNASMKGAGTWGTMWRLLPLWDSSVDRFITRDIDSVPLVRDWATTYEWIRLSQLFPSYRWADNVKHYSHPILAGALGISRDSLTSKQRGMLLSKFQNKAKFMTKYGDQEWLEQNVWPLVKHNMLSFDVEHCESGVYPNVQPFPIPHSQCDWIMGGPDDFFGQRDEVPQECLHKQHASWKWG